MDFSLGVDLADGDGIKLTFQSGDTLTLQGIANEWFATTPQNTNLNGTSGDDTLFGGAGNNLILAGDGNDFVSGGGGDDNINGGNGNDVVFGGNGNDLLSGGDGDDRGIRGARAETPPARPPERTPRGERRAHP